MSWFNFYPAYTRRTVSDLRAEVLKQNFDKAQICYCSFFSTKAFAETHSLLPNQATSRSSQSIPTSLAKPSPSPAPRPKHERLQFSEMSNYIPYASRAGFEDLLPVTQADGPNPLVPIAYTEQCESCSAVSHFILYSLHFALFADRDTMDTFRALVKKNEKSPRGLALTESLIRMNPGHYSIWSVRRSCGRLELVLMA